jgi:hypothetical protein
MRKLMETFAAKPMASIPEACDNWTETHTVYRFLSNPRVTWDGILAPHWARTLERMGTQQVVLCMQDTTELDFSGQEIAGLGPLSYEARRGMYVHPTYAVTRQSASRWACLMAGCGRASHATRTASSQPM